MGRVSHKDKEQCKALLVAMKEDVVAELEQEERAVLDGSVTLQAQLDADCREVITQELRLHSVK
jgi:hypothetical protein